MYQVTIYTDGACSGNPGFGGYSAIISCNGAERVVCGNAKSMTTNNRMELTAVIEALKALKKPCDIICYTDSKYIIDCSAHDRSWLTSEARPNRDLWVELITVGLKGQHKIKFIKVKGHSGNKYNERCDKYAKAECAKARHNAYENG